MERHTLADFVETVASHRQGSVTSRLAELHSLVTSPQHLLSKGIFEALANLPKVRHDKEKLVNIEKTHLLNLTINDDSMTGMWQVQGFMFFALVS